jgi:hypothetical protein
MLGAQLGEVDPCGGFRHDAHPQPLARQPHGQAVGRLDRHIVQGGLPRGFQPLHRLQTLHNHDGAGLRAIHRRAQRVQATQQPLAPRLARQQRKRQHDQRRQPHPLRAAPNRTAQSPQHLKPHTYSIPSRSRHRRSAYSKVCSLLQPSF